mgnify:CR=1 FL=1
MTVALTKAMEYLKDDLAALGYDCVTMDNRIHGCDAVVYGGEKMPELNQNSLTDSSAASNGVLMVNGERKTAEQIHAMLQHRLYSPLFNQTFM